MGALGENIKKARINKGLKQEDLAKILGKSKNVISNWERGENKPDADILALICGILDVDANYLLDYNENITFAANRSDSYDNDLPPEALKELEQYKEFLRMKYKKKGKDTDDT